MIMLTMLNIMTIKTRTVVRAFTLVSKIPEKSPEITGKVGRFVDSRFAKKINK